MRVSWTRRGRGASACSSPEKARGKSRLRSMVVGVRCGTSVGMSWSRVEGDEPRERKRDRAPNPAALTR